MQSVSQAAINCLSKNCDRPEGLALITIGNQSPEQDNLVSGICDLVCAEQFPDVCRHALDSRATGLAECLARHQAAVIFDTTNNSSPPRTVSIADIGAALNNPSQSIKSVHGVSILRELRAAKRTASLPRRTILFGIETDKATQDQSGTNQASRVPQLEENLSCLIIKILETVSRAA